MAEVFLQDAFKYFTEMTHLKLSAGIINYQVELLTELSRLHGSQPTEEMEYDLGTASIRLASEYSESVEEYQKRFAIEANNIFTDKSGLTHVQLRDPTNGATDIYRECFRYHETKTMPELDKFENVDDVVKTEFAKRPLVPQTDPDEEQFLKNRELMN